MHCETDHLCGKLQLAQHDIVHPMLAQVQPFVSTMSACHNDDSWIEPPRLIHHHARYRQVIERNHQYARLGNSGVLQQDGIGAIPSKGRDAALTKLLHPAIVLLNDDVAEIPSIESVCHDSAHAPITAENRVPPQLWVLRIVQDGQFVRASIQQFDEPRTPAYEALRGLDQSKDPRVRCDGENGCSENQIVASVGKQPKVATQLSQNE